MNAYSRYKERLELVNFNKYLDKLAKMFKNKKIVIYGAGLLFSVIQENYELDKFNIVGITDQKFSFDKEKESKGFKTISPNELREIDFNVLFIALYSFSEVEPDLHEFKKSLKKDIKIVPLYRQTLKEKLDELENNPDYM